MRLQLTDLQNGIDSYRALPFEHKSEPLLREAELLWREL